MAKSIHLYRMLPDNLAPFGPYHPVLCKIIAYQNVVAMCDSYRGRQALING